MSKMTLPPPPRSEGTTTQDTTIVVRSAVASQKNRFRNIVLVTGRELNARVKQRSFTLSSIVLIVLVVIAACIPTLIQVISAHSHTQTSLVVVNNAGTIGTMDESTLLQSMKNVLNGPASTQGQNASSDQFAMSTSTTDVKSLQKKVSDGSITILFVIDRATDQSLHFTYYTNASPTNASGLAQAQQVQAVATILNEQDVSANLHLTAKQQHQLFSPPVFSFVQTSQKTRSVGDQLAGFLIAYAGIILIFIALQLYGVGVANGIAEEKGSRIIEILINAATPFQLLAGKVLGIGLAGMAQMSAVVIAGIAALEVQDPLQRVLLGSQHTSGLALNITGVSVSILLCVLLYFVLGFFLYATLFAALGALVKRQDEVQNAVAPLTLVFWAAYLVSFFGASTPDAAWFKVLSFIPFFTPTTMLVRVGTGTAASWEIAVSAVVMILSIILCTAIAARIYRAAVLMYGQKPGLGQLVKIARTR